MRDVFKCGVKYKASLLGSLVEIHQQRREAPLGDHIALE